MKSKFKTALDFEYFPKEINVESEEEKLEKVIQIPQFLLCLFLEKLHYYLNMLSFHNFQFYAMKLGI